MKKIKNMMKKIKNMSLRAKKRVALARAVAPLEKIINIYNTITYKFYYCYFRIITTLNKYPNSWKYILWGYIIIRAILALIHIYNNVGGWGDGPRYLAIIDSSTSNSNPLNIPYEGLLSADKAYYPSHLQNSDLFACEKVPVYGNKLVKFKPSSLLQNRNLPEMSIDIPKSPILDKATELRKVVEDAKTNAKFYELQREKFIKIIEDIDNGTEKFYPKQARRLFVNYVDLTKGLSSQERFRVHEAIGQLRKLDTKFAHDAVERDN